ncbi:RHS repeat domain-containing protein, partial [Flavobacterium sp. CF136]|uniref:RHS repeat domain-containing protein n=1 Tax=Flavobacterium sp. (strain CF136) TaxID=1144313 RepID=UPI000271C9AE
KDNNKNITVITYNHLNLPTKITFATTGSIVYIYNATGQKVQKIVNETGKAAITTDYLGGYQYDNALLKFFPTAEGYVEPSGSSYKYVYQYKDHLGNVRLSYDKTLAIKEESNFYPFGLKQEGYNNVKSGVENKYKFNGKELQDELGLGFYDYGMRNYDPALGRWMNIDPLAEKMRRYSPYTYALDSPVFFVDPDGMQAEAGQSGNYYDWDEKQYKNKDTGATVTAEEAIASHSSESDDGGDPPKKKPGLFKQFLLAVPVLGATIDSSDKMGEGDYLGAALSFGAGVMDLFTLGTANKYKTGTAGVIAGVEVAAAEQAGKYGGLSVAEKYGIKSYSALKTLLKGKGLQAHHLIEQRFAGTLGVTPGSMSSIAVTAEEHQIFTNAWRAEIGYEGSKATTTTLEASKTQIYSAAKRIYKDYPQILKALGL